MIRRTLLMVHFRSLRFVVCMDGPFLVIPREDVTLGLDILGPTARQLGGRIRGSLLATPAPVGYGSKGFWYCSPSDLFESVSGFSEGIRFPHPLPCWCREIKRRDGESKDSTHSTRTAFRVSSKCRRVLQHQRSLYSSHLCWR